MSRLYVVSQAAGSDKRRRRVLHSLARSKIHPLSFQILSDRVDGVSSGEPSSVFAPDGFPALI